MKKLNLFLILFSGALLMNGGCQSMTKMQVPRAEKKSHAFELHGDHRSDDYFWMRKRDSKEVLSYLKAENKYAETMLEPVGPLKKQLFEEMRGRIKEDDSSVPYLKNGYYYYYRFEKNKEYPIHCRKKGSLDAHEQVLLDVNQMAKGHDYYDVGEYEVSPDGKWLGFAVDSVGRRKYTLHFKNLIDGKISETKIPDTTGNFVWANDSENIFYTTQHPETLRFEKIFRFHLPLAKNELVYFETDEMFFVHVAKSLSNDFIFISSESKTTSEVRYLPANQPLGHWKIFEPRTKEHEYQVEHGGDRFYILTNWKAKNFRLMEAQPESTTRASWKEVLKHDSKALLEDILVLSSQVVVLERKEGLKRLRIFDRKTAKSDFVQFPEAAYVTALSTNEEYQTPFFRYSYQSPKTPPSVFDYDFKTKQSTLRKRQEVLGGFQSDDYTVERTSAKATDDTLIPISIVYKKGFKKDGSMPLLQYGYGSYGYSTDPTFSVTRLSLLDRGFAFAIAHVRGGSEMGRHWYEEGKLLKKKNTFTDFVTVSESLIEKKYTSPKKLVIMGGSAGGLLMGAVMNLRPELYQGVIAVVPFVDALNTMLDDKLPLTTFEYEEWGNPNEKPYYEYIKSYSPYDNVEAKAYPNLLVTTGYHDSQVQYWEPAKWVAKIREKSTSGNLVLFETDMESGHSGTTGRFKSLELTALHYAFALMVTK